MHWIDLANEGEYDPLRWVVVLDYASLSIAQGATVRFLNHPTRAPVVMRAVGPIAIDGALVLDGAPGNSAFLVQAEPGPGGYRGGLGRAQAYERYESAGHGSGGGEVGVQSPAPFGGNASHASEGSSGGQVAPAGREYGSVILPLRGGSGGGGSYSSTSGTRSGGAGGGALLLGSDTSIHIGGTISARGGSGDAAGSGSGGTLRLASPSITWSGSGNKLDASGGSSAGHGWIRVETDVDPGDIPALPGAIVAPLGDFLPPDPTAIPSVTLAYEQDSMGAWKSIDQDPLAIVSSRSLADLKYDVAGVKLFLLEGRHVPFGAPLEVRTTYMRDGGAQPTIDDTHTMGESPGPLGEPIDEEAVVQWTAIAIDVSPGVSTVQVRAVLR